METNLTKSLIKNNDIDEDLLKPEYFELSRDYIPVIYEHKLWHIIHSSRDIEKAIVNNYTNNKFVSTKYIIKTSDQLTDIPVIKTVPNFKVQHSIEEIEDFYNSKIKILEDDIKRVKIIKERVIKKARNINIPEKNIFGYSNKTKLVDILKDRR